jgi:hypothetical protein
LKYLSQELSRFTEYAEKRPYFAPLERRLSQKMNSRKLKQKPSQLEPATRLLRGFATVSVSFNSPFFRRIAEKNCRKRFRKSPVPKISNPRKRSAAAWFGGAGVGT